jgi:hypothetical protein
MNTRRSSIDDIISPAHDDLTGARQLAKWEVERLVDLHRPVISGIGKEMRHASRAPGSFQYPRFGIVPQQQARSCTGLRARMIHDEDACIESVPASAGEKEGAAWDSNPASHP